MSNYQVNVYEDGKIVGRVAYRQNLDMWNGRDWCRGQGLHLGISRLKNGKFVLIHGSQWEGSKDYAEVISDSEALQEIMDADPDILEEPKFSDLKKLSAEILCEEWA